jgi:dihydrofolate reductase
MHNLSLIVAIANNNAIGINNALLCHLPDDLKRFKRLTTGNKVIMGKRTFFSLPRRPLPNRINIVITDIENEQLEGCTMAYSINQVLELCRDGQESFVIGGASVYKQMLPLCNTLYLTRIYADFEADAFFDSIDFDEWELIENQPHEADETNAYPFAYLTYKRKLN